MSEKRFRVRFEQEDGKGEIVNEKGVELTAREVVDCLNGQLSIIRRDKMSIENMMSNMEKLEKENEQLKKELKWKREEIKALIEESERDE